MIASRENPLTSLAADVAATKQALAKQEPGKTISAGHPGARRGHHRSRQRSQGLGAGPGLGLRARRGAKSLASLAKAGPGTTEGASVIHADAKGNLTIEIPRCFHRRSRPIFQPKIAESLANAQLPLNHTAFEAPVDTAAWHDKPTFYVISTRDKVIAPEAQKMFAARIKAQTTEVAGSHASLVVHAREVAAVI